MKLLSTEQQIDLINFMENLSEVDNLPGNFKDVSGWCAQELKPKRVRRKATEENTVTLEENS